MGVWLSTDPKDQLFNPYGYSTNPIMTIDPDGQYILGALIGGAVGFAAGGLIGGAMNDKGWSWSAAFSGMMMGASLGSGIENNIIASKWASGTLSANRYTYSATRYLMKTNPGLIDHYASKQTVVSGD